MFLQTPNQYTIEEALRWGQILGLEGEQPLVRAVNGTPLGTTFDNEDFWKTVIHFFVNNPMLDPDHVVQLSTSSTIRSRYHRKSLNREGKFCSCLLPNPT